MAMALDGILVVDWTVWNVGAAAATVLADFGAEVIHVEERKHGDPMRGFNQLFGMSMELPGGRVPMFEDTDRNKKSISIDLKKPSGMEIMHRLIDKSDVFVTNYRVEAATRLGLDPETVSKRNSRIIYVQASGFGPKGSERHKGALEWMGYARSGLMTSSGAPGMPPIVITAGAGDRAAAICGACGILVALLARERLGVAQTVSYSLLGGTIAIAAPSVATAFLCKRELPKHDRARAHNPLGNYYRCADGRWIIFNSLEDKHWTRFCQALGLSDLQDNPRFATSVKRAANKELLVSLFDKIFATKTCEEWEKILGQSDLIFTHISDISDLASDPQVLANQYVIDVDHPALGSVKMPGFPIELSKTPASWRRCAPELGEHTEEVLLEICGYTWDDIRRFQDEQVI